jgi:hypothetical protein
MRILSAGLATVSILLLLELSMGAPAAEAAPGYCKYRYSLCLARCEGRPRYCVRRCQGQYRACRLGMPYLGDLI